MKFRQQLASLCAGSMSPQLRIQITPLLWGLAVGTNTYHVGVQIGPVALAFDWHPLHFYVQKELKRAKVKV